MIEFNLEKELRELDIKTDEYLLDFEGPDYMQSAVYIYMFNLEDYDKLIIKLNQLRYSATSYQEKLDFINDYKKVYFAKRLKFGHMLNNLNNGSLKVRYNKELDDNIDILKNLIGDSFDYNNDISHAENVLKFIKAKIKSRIYEVNNDIYKLKKFPHEYINTLSAFIAPYNPTKYERDIIFYKDVFICCKENHHFGVFYNENSLEETKRAILNILAYINAEPYFYLTGNPSFNRKIDDLYIKFDLMDMVRLRRRDYFDSNIDEPFHIESPIIKTYNGFNFIKIEDVQYEMIFELYHASLKQFESLPRCVFLYRAFEYGVNFYYNPTYHPTVATPEVTLNHLFNLAMNHIHMPLYYIDLGSYITKDNNTIINKRKPAYRNFILKLKEEARIITQEWSQHPYLNSMSVGQIIYNTGRNASAHGGAGQHNARYDYSRNYKHINDVNIFLELIVRYLIEKMNPHISKMVERRKKYYIQYNGYEKIFKNE